MNSGDEKIAQDIPPFQKGFLKLTCDNLDSCKKNPMASPVILKTERKCHFCKIKENNKLKFGPLYSLNQIVAHYYCILLSTRMKQNGKDDEGIMGFLFRDINLELKRSKNISCAYCQEKNATVKCAHQGCKKVFHYPCGLESGALSRFRNDFISFCYQHRPKQKIPKKILEEVANTELICAICYEAVDFHDRIDNLWAPCCLKTWYHRNCVQKLAQSSGYFFRCATCNDSEKFKDYMEDNGIFVPQQDASWELVPNAYEELLVRHGTCDAEKCKCPKGREENVEDTRWEITLCRFCGSQGIHVGCGNLKFSDPQWECPTCKSIMKTDSDSNSKSKPKANANSKPMPKSKKLELEAKKLELESKKLELESKNLEQEYKSDLAVKKTAPKSGDQPATVARKRKLSEQQETMDKRKRGSGSSDDEKNDCNAENKSNDEFYIRIPGWKYDKPHTTTKPDDEDENKDENKIEIKNNDANENGNDFVDDSDSDSSDTSDSSSVSDSSGESSEDDEDVDVITYEAAWLMVEEVLSRVKPAPLWYKIKLIRKKCFAYHFDPFDVRVEGSETVDLASNTENNRPAIQPTEETDSDIEIIEEFLVNKKKTEVDQGSPNMEVDNPVPQASDMAGAPESREEKMEECARAEGPEEVQIYDVSDDEGPSNEIRNYLFKELENFNESQAFEDPIVSSTDETINMTLDEDEEEQIIDNDLKFEYGSCLYEEEDNGAEGDKSSDSSEEEFTQRQIGSRKRGSKIKYYHKIKRRRVTAAYLRAQQKLNRPCLASQSMSSGRSSFNVGYTGEPTFDNDPTLNSGVSNAAIMSQQNQSGLIVPDTPAELSTRKDSFYTAPITSTMVTPGFQTSEMAESSSSHLQAPTTSLMQTFGHSTNGMATFCTSTSQIHPAASVTSSPSSPSMNLSGFATSKPCTPLMPASEMDASKTLSDEESSDSETDKPDSRAATPLPSLNFLTNLKLSISPLLSQSSNSSSALPLPIRGQRLLHHIDVSSSSEESNDGLPECSKGKQSPPPS